MNNPVRARQYRTEDREACLAVFDANTPSSFSPAERPAFEAFLRDLPGPYTVMEDDEGQVMACGGCAFEQDGETASLCWGMVLPARQGEGLGRSLLEVRIAAVERDARCRSIRLETTEDTAGFFEKMGFEVVAIREDGLGPGLRAVEMKLLL